MNALCEHGGRKTKEYPQGRPLAPKTVRHIVSVVHSCFQKAIRWEMIVRNPISRVELPKLVKKQPKVVEKDAVRNLLQRAQRTRLYPFLVLALATGARRGELLALEMGRY